MKQLAQLPQPDCWKPVTSRVVPQEFGIQARVAPQEFGTQFPVTRVVPQQFGILWVDRDWYYQYSRSESQKFVRYCFGRHSGKHEAQTAPADRLKLATLAQRYFYVPYRPPRTHLRTLTNHLALELRPEGSEKPHPLQIVPPQNRNQVRLTLIHSQYSRGSSMHP